MYRPPVSDGEGYNRENLRKAKAILDQAGYRVRDHHQLVNAQGQAIRFEILLSASAFERIVNPFIKNLSRLGIQASIRLVDTAQYVNRVRNFDYDMLVAVLPQEELPGEALNNMFSSESAQINGSFNRMGIRNPVVDALIKKITAANDQQTLTTAIRALDRVLLHNHYVIPQWYSPSSRIVHWNKFAYPDVAPKFDRYYRTGLHTWWYDADKAQRLNNKKPMVSSEANTTDIRSPHTKKHTDNGSLYSQTFTTDSADATRHFIH